ncbi:MAG TPA: serine/threonine-protein kinase [Nannocystaceae bacterium]|nr:serine/threonine-protein kinase [Nannocystaceae bacterium]
MSGERRVRIGRYVVVERLGVGGMGTVWVAYDPELDRKVALKVLRSDRARDDAADVHRARLQREAQALARLSHPNIVTVYDVGTVDGSLFLAMELIDGCNLRAWVRAQRRSVDEILQVFASAAAGLAAAHAAGIVHRDFKPDNVVIGPGDPPRVVVLDFGLAHRDEHPRSLVLRSRDDKWKDGEALTRPGRAMGTPAYMAPEQHAAGTIEPRTDQYSWCISLWEALTGMRPFGVQTSALLRHKLAVAIPPLDPAGAIPAWLYPVLERGLAARPEDRHRSMHALLDAIAEARPRARSRRARMLVATTAGLAMLAITVTLLVPAPIDRCESGEERIAAAWNQPRRLAIATAFADSGIGYARTAWTLLAPRVDDWTARWRERWSAACSGDAPVERELQCLERRLQTLEARLAVLAAPSTETIENATRMIAELPAPERCLGGDPTELVDVDPGTREQVALVRELLADVEARELAGRYGDALARARVALAEAQRCGWPPVQAEARLRVGRLHKALGEYEDAERELADAAWTAVASRHDEIAAQAMTELVVVVGRELSRPEQGRRWAHDATAAIANAGGDELLEANLLSNLGLLQFREGEYDEARRGDELALTMRTRALGREHPLVASSHNNLGSDLWMLGRHREAESHLRDAIAIHEAVLGPEHPRLATALDNLGALLAERGDVASARPLVERALEIRERALGPEHPSLADTLINLGNLARASDDLDRAEALFERARGIVEHQGGADHPTLATCLANLAGIQLDRKQYARAEQSYARAAAIYEAVLGRDHVKVGLTLANLGEVLRLRGDHARAIVELERAVTIVEHALGPEHPQLAFPLEGLGRARLAAGDAAAAIDPLARAVAIETRLDVVGGDLAELEGVLARARAQAG